MLSRCVYLLGLACGVFALTGGAARAEIYKFVDDEGNVTYTNIQRPGKRGEVVVSDPKAANPAGAADKLAPYKPRSTGKAFSRSPGYFPKVDAGTQRKRDDLRRQLLEEEMRSEERSLGAARSALAQGSRQPGADLKKLQDAVSLHQKNIEMLTKELSHIR